MPDNKITHCSRNELVGTTGEVIHQVGFDGQFKPRIVDYVKTRENRERWRQRYMMLPMSGNRMPRIDGLIGGHNVTALPFQIKARKAEMVVIDGEMQLCARFEYDTMQGLYDHKVPFLFMTVFSHDRDAHGICELLDIPDRLFVAWNWMFTFAQYPAILRRDFYAEADGERKHFVYVWQGLLPEAFNSRRPVLSLLNSQTCRAVGEASRHTQGLLLPPHTKQEHGLLLRSSAEHLLHRQYGPVEQQQLQLEFDRLKARNTAISTPHLW